VGGFTCARPNCGQYIIKNSLECPYCGAKRCMSNSCVFMNKPKARKCEKCREPFPTKIKRKKTAIVEKLLENKTLPSMKVRVCKHTPTCEDNCYNPTIYENELVPEFCQCGEACGAFCKNKGPPVVFENDEPLTGLRKNLVM